MYVTKEKVLLKSENPKTLGEISEFLRALADKVQDGNLILKQAGEEVNLSLPQNCVLEVKVEEEPRGDTKKYQLEVEIEWSENGKEQEIELA